jgi:uroporphyrinogen decarboxylase
MNKRDAVMSLLDPGYKAATIPAAFFLHFDPAYHRGQAAVDKHLEYFYYTGMDFVKIQYEHSFPHIPAIQQPEDWANMPFYGLDFYAEPLKVVEGLVRAAKPEALVLLTLYSPFMCARHTTSDALITSHIRQDPEKVKRGMEIITASLMLFVKECIRLGLDGFYTSTQGGESGRFDDPALFDTCIKPYDLALMEEINRQCIFNILHVCDYELPYSDLTPFVDFPGQVVNTSLELTGGGTSAREVASQFGRPFMGGLDRKGVLATGSPEEIRQAVHAAIDQAPQRFILGADCTVPAGTPWDNLRTAIIAAHEYR